MLWVILAAIVLAVTVIVLVLRWRASTVRLEDQIAGLVNFRVTHRFDQRDKRASILVDRHRKAFAIVTAVSPVTVYAFDRLASVTAEKDGLPLRIAHRCARYFAEGNTAVLDLVGLIVASSNAAGRNGGLITRLTLKLFVDDGILSAHEIVFFSSPHAMRVESPEVTLAAVELSEWFSRFLRMRESPPPAYAVPPRLFGRGEHDP